MASLKGKKGVDVSTWQGNIDWSKVKGKADFAIIRGGFGSNTVDNRAVSNIKGCTSQKIPFGLYWFSYALSVSDSAKEADYACDMADKYKITLPVIGYDWEEDSEEYAKNHGVKMTQSLRLQYAKAFCDRVKARGYVPLLYINYNDLDNGFDTLTKTYDVWFASPGGSKPSVGNLAFWQYSWSGSVSGIDGDVDMNICYKDFTVPALTTSPAPTPAPAAKPPAGHPTSCSLTFAYLGQGWSCNVSGQVRTVQRILNTCNYKGKDGKPLAEDGVYGVNTEYAVIAYQKKHSLDADGVVGPATWKALTGAK